MRQFNEYDEIKTVRFTRMFRALTNFIPESNLQWFETEKDNGIELKIVASFYARLFPSNSDRTVNEVYSHPTGWWQWFKKDFFPEWLLKKFPVKYSKVETAVTINNEIYHVCPHLPTESPDLHYRFLSSKVENGEHVFSRFK